MSHLPKIVFGFVAIQSVEAANISGVIDVTGFAYSAGSATITGTPSVNFDCEINDGWSGYIDPTLSIVSSGLGSFSSPNIDVSVSPSFIPTIDGEWTSRCSLSSSGSYTLNISGYIPYISETFTGKSGKLVCEPTLSYNNVTGTLSGQYTSCRFNPAPTPTPTTPTCDDSHLDQCITQEQCESIDKYWYSDQCNVTPEITFESVLTSSIAINGGDSQQSATLNLSDSVEVSGNITVASAHVGQTADLFVYAETTIPGIPDTLYFMLKGEPGLEILSWDQNEDNLVAFQSNVTLAAEQPVSIYSGNFIYPGSLKVYFGYRLTDGTLVKNSEPIDIIINDDSMPFQ